MTNGLYRVQVGMEPLPENKAKTNKAKIDRNRNTKEKKQAKRIKEERTVR